MASPRISQSLDRIDRALARIETQTALAQHRAAADDSDLSQRHAALRASVGESLQTLDALIREIEA